MKRTISDSMPAIALRDQVVPDTPLAEKTLIPKPGAASKGRNLRARLPFDRVVLLLQGGGALGAYQAGVYQALAETGLHPDWVVGISIGAINAAIIAGNAPERRVERLREFWRKSPPLPWASTPTSSASLNEARLRARSPIR
jgi:NTE family protein